MSDARSIEGNLRRTRSAGDIPSNDPRYSPSSQFSPTFPRSPESNDDEPESPPIRSEQTDTPEQRDEPTVPIVHPSVQNLIAARRIPSPPPRQHNRSLYSRTMAFFGYGRGASRARRLIVSLVWNLTWGFTQIVVVITLLALSANLKSPTQPDKTEWDACDRPLGVWACLWIIRVVIACFLTYWGFDRDRQTANRTDAEAQDAWPPSGPAAAQPRRRTTPANLGVTASPNPNSPSNTNSDAPPLPHTALFRRLSLFSSLFSLSWFLTAHILEYTSINTCRLSSPHNWWLIFGILCITYLMVLEVIILGFIVFIIAPIIFLVWNIFLMCLGRHPIQNPNMIRPEIGKLPKSVVDRIPLVMYIPPPPDAPPSDGPIKIPETAYTYPPKSPSIPSSLAPKRRFKFLRFKSKKDKTETEVAPASKETTEGKKPQDKFDPQTWEDHWEQEGYPFVILEGNRASCAICLLDFEEPKRAGQASEPPKEAEEETAEETAEASSSQPKEIIVENITEEERDEQLRLQDVGEGPQPLRLLACGHVFHKPCLDPWLIDVSGRCPVCQRAVDIPEPEKKKRRRR